MNDLTITTQNLPAEFEDVAAFAVLAQEKLKSVRAEISAIKRLKLAEDVLKQKTLEAQELAEIKTRAEMKLGELTAAMPTAQGMRMDLTSYPTETKLRTKEEALNEVGIRKKKASEYERMAAHPEIVEQAMAEARENGDIVSRASILKKVEAETKQPHVAFNSGNNEWYTPVDYIEAARHMMGSIDIDPASSDIAQETVKAATYYTAETNGLDKPWWGNVWMNPPYASDLIGQFIDKLIMELPNIEQAVVLVNNATETEWFGKLVAKSSAICFPRSRVKFYLPDGKVGAPLQGQALLYFGNNPDKFVLIFGEKGWCAIPQ